MKEKIYIFEMTYINQSTISIVMPKIFGFVPTKLKCENQISHKVITLNVEDQNTNTSIYNLNITDDDWQEQFENGQYDYVLLDENDVLLETGILQFGDYIPTGVSNYQNEINIIQYNG